MYKRQGLIQHQTVLDYGCGSGILAIAAKKFGAGLVCGIDVDPQAIISGKLNALQNNVSIQFGLPDSLTSDSHFQIVVANILTNPLQVLAPAICSHLAPDGRLALCGILERQAKQVIDTYAPWVLLTVKESLDGWVFLTGSPIVSSK